MRLTTPGSIGWPSCATRCRPRPASAPSGAPSIDSVTVKKTVHADEQRRPDVAAPAASGGLAAAARVVGIFLDECGVTTDLLRRYGRSPRGTRLHDPTPCRHWQTHTVIAGLRLDGLTAPAVFDGPIDTPTFRAYVEQVWCRRCARAMSSSSTTWPSTSSPEIRAAIEAAARTSASCRPTVRTSIRSNRPSPN